MAIALSHGGVTMSSSPSPSDTLLVGTTQGLVRLEHDRSGNWSEAGRALDGEHIHALVHEPNSELWFAGAYRSGVFASADGGRTWERRNDGLTETSVFSIAATQLPGGSVRLYAGTEPAHLFFSDDLGQQWTELPALRSAGSLPNWRFAAEPFAAHTKHISFAPGDPVTLYVSVEVGGLHKSTDGGMTFMEVPVPHLDVHRTVVHPQDPQRVYLTGGAGVFVSPDGAETWEQLLEKSNHIGSYPDMLVCAPSRPDVMFLCSSQNGPRSWVEKRVPAGGQIARTTDGGRTWSPCMNGLPSDRFRGSIEAMCLEDVAGVLSLFVADTDGNIAWSVDGGDSWKLIAQLPPVSKSVHAEMMQGGGPTPLKFSDGELVINGVRVKV